MVSNFIKSKVIILCGGRGKRLGKITNQIPKPLVKIGKLSIIEHKLKYYKKQGLKDFIFCIGYKGKIIKKFLEKKCSNPLFYYKGVNTGILKRIYLARDSIKTTSIISYGDTLAKINFKDLLKNHKKSKSLMTLVVAPIQNPFGLVDWNRNGVAHNFNEKPMLNHFIGYAVIEPNLFNYLNKSIINLNNGKGMVKAIKTLIQKKLVNVYKFKGLQMTVNSVSELRDANTKIGNYFTFDEII